MVRSSVHRISRVLPGFDEIHRDRHLYLRHQQRGRKRPPDRSPHQAGHGWRPEEGSVPVLRRFLRNQLVLLNIYVYLYYFTLCI